MNCSFIYDRSFKSFEQSVYKMSKTGINSNKIKIGYLVDKKDRKEAVNLNTTS